jgi:hypothetical protein
MEEIQRIINEIRSIKTTKLSCEQRKGELDILISTLIKERNEINKSIEDCFVQETQKHRELDIAMKNAVEINPTTEQTNANVPLKKTTKRREQNDDETNDCKHRKKPIRHDRNSDLELIPNGVQFIGKKDEHSIVATKLNGKFVVDNIEYDNPSRPMSLFKMNVTGESNGNNGWTFWKTQVDGKLVTMKRYVEIIKENKEKIVSKPSEPIVSIVSKKKPNRATNIIVKQEKNCI